MINEKSTKEMMIEEWSGIGQVANRYLKKEDIYMLTQEANFFREKLETTKIATQK